MKPFSKWTIEEVEEEFQIILDTKNERLNAWMQVRPSISSEEGESIARLGAKLRASVWDWNEEELKINFIAKLLDLVDFEQEQYKAFFSREISTRYKNESLGGIVDFLVASGKRTPKHPYFFIHEYKKEHDTSDDPLGQLMVAMVTAAKLNNDAQPIYGVYILERYWHFTILEGQIYEVHTGLNAADEDIHQIFAVLKNTKQKIEERTQQVKS